MALCRARYVGFLVLSLLCPASFGQDAKNLPDPPRSIFDTRLEQLRKASVTWDVRRGPDRQVVDIVCLVPDVPTFLEAIKTWDREHYFPILLDDVELNLKFIRAFRPSKVVRFPKKAEAIPDQALMDTAIAAAGHSWREPGSEKGLPGGEVAELMPPAEPGIVVTNSRASSLAAAVALAAGRFEPLLEWTWEKTHDEKLDDAGADAAAEALNELIVKIAPEYRGLGDPCDFITLAGDWPYRYQASRSDPKGPRALDDLLGRDPRNGVRSAFIGRLIGTSEQCVYQAMCSLFLSAESATFFDTYDPKSPLWSLYSMSKIRPGLSKELPNKVWPVHEGPGPAIWHGAFDPVNQAGLVMVNTRGGPAEFFLPTDKGKTADIPFSAPTAIHFLHSFSAQNPYDHSTLASRWLANGAYAYYGSMHEPFLTSFRTPELIADLLAYNMPLVAAFRQGPTEVAGFPWRLVYFGDPLCRLRPVKKPGARLTTWPAVDSWPAYPSSPAGAPPTMEDEALAWALKLALGSASEGRRDPKTASMLFDLLAKTPRGRLPETLRPILDALCVDLYAETRNLSALRSRLAAIPDGDRNDDNRRWRDTVAVMELSEAMRARDTIRVGVIWETLARSDTSTDLKLSLIDRLTPFFAGMNRLVTWSERVRAAAPAFAGTDANPAFQEALKKLESRPTTKK